jgi:surface protein
MVMIRDVIKSVGKNAARSLDMNAFSWSSYWNKRKPTNLIVTAQTDTTIDFSWDAGVDAPENFKLKISTDGVTYTDKTTVAGNVTTAQATGLTAGTLYYFKVVAAKGAKESDPTNIYDTRFKITVDTTKAGSANNTFILPAPGGAFVYDYYLDKGDGTAESHITSSASQTLVYTNPGVYQIKIRGTFPQIFFNNAGDKLKLIHIDNWGNIKMGPFQSGSFSGCANMTGTYIDCPNTSEVTIMTDMFSLCPLFNSPVNFDTINVRAMNNMFRGDNAFNQSVASFNTAKCTDFATMFMQCHLFNQEVNHFDTSQATDLHNMFDSCYVFNKPVSNFNTAKCTNFRLMFNECWKFNQSVANFDTSSGTEFHRMFQNCKVFNQPVPFDTSSAVTMYEMFKGCTVFNQSVATFDVSGVVNMSGIFSLCPAFNQSLETWVTTSATNMSYLFDGCTVFNGSIASFDTSSVTDMSYMFRSCKAFNQSVASFNTAQVTNMSYMFYECWVFNQSVASFNTAQVTNMSYMFAYCRAFNQSVASFNTALVTTMAQMFVDCRVFNQPVAFDLSKATNLSQMFQQCANFNQDISGWDVSKVTTMNLMLFLANAWSTANYDAALIAWSALTLTSAVPFHAGDAKYSAGAAATARGVLTSAPNSWIITDGGQA